MNILILSDILNNWALHNRAKAIQKFLPQHNIQIAGALDDDRWIQRSGHFDLIHFNFSYGITDFERFVYDNPNRTIITIVNERSLFNAHGVSVPKFVKMICECPNVTSVSKKVADIFPHIQYIPNGIDEDIFFKKKTITVGYAGTTDKPNKNVASIRQACQELGLIFKAASYNRDQQDNHDYPLDKMQDFYNSVDVYIHASLTEGFNNTVIEALSCNVPVLMTRQGCWQEFEGWVDFIEPTVDGVKSGLRKYMGRLLVKEKFLWKNIVPKYGELYERAFACKNKIS